MARHPVPKAGAAGGIPKAESRRPAAKRGSANGSPRRPLAEGDPEVPAPDKAQPGPEQAPPRSPPPALVGKQHSGQFQLNRALLIERMRMGAPIHFILTQLVDDYGMTADQARHGLNSLLKEITATNQAEIQALRSLATTRLQRDLLTMRGAKKPSWTSIARHESLLADLQGTKQHKVEIDMPRASIYQAVIDTMSEQRLEEIARAQIEAERRAGITNLKIVDTTGESA